MDVREVMSTPVIVLRPRVPVRAAAALLVSHGFTAAPVVDAEGRVLGMATEADLMRGRVAPRGSVDEGDPHTTVVEVMTPVGRVAEPSEDLADLVASMLASGVRTVPVLDGGRLVGVVTRRDVLRAVARRELAGPGR